MRDFVNSQEQILVGRCADKVRGAQEFPGEKGRVAEQVGAQDLQADDEQDEVFGQRLWPAELRYLARL